MVTEMDVGAEEAVETVMQEEEEKGDRCDFIFCEFHGVAHYTLQTLALSASRRAQLD